MSTPVKDISRLAMQALAVNSSSTHGLAPEASAARLIRSLRAAYTDETSVSVQASLIEYLQSLIKPSALVLTDEVRLNPSIAATVQVIDLIIASDRWNDDEQRMILTQMASIAGTYPKLSWDSNHERWSSNRIYNAASQTHETVMASPAETLNWVCRAMLDRERYEESISGDSADEGFRIESLACSLLRLQQQKEMGQYETCSAGRQHEMLFLLNKSYLDNPRAAGGKPFELIEDTKTFLLDSLSRYIVAQLDTISESQRETVILEWIRWQADFKTTDASPIVVCLERVLGAGWMSHCQSYLSDRSGAFGLAPAPDEFTAIIAEIECLPVPTSEGMLVPLVSSIAQEKLFSIPSEPPTMMGGAGGDGGHELMIRSNQACIAIKEAIKNPSYIKYEPQSIKDFYTAWEATKSLVAYRKLTIFVGTEEGSFHEACERLTRALLLYYTDFRLDKVLEASFFTCYSVFIEKQREFHTRSHLDFVVNFFALLSSDRPIRPYFERLEALQSSSMDKHPLLLTDEHLSCWYRDSVTMNEDGVATIDISPYQINRILLHAFLAPYETWTTLYIDSLRTVREWLFKPILPSDSGLVNAFKASYQTSIPENLLLTCLGQLLDPGEAGALNFILLRVLMQLTTRQRTQIWKAIESRGVYLIANLTQLETIFNFPETYLTMPERTEILMMIGKRLEGMITDSAQLKRLFSIPITRLSIDQRSYILSAIRDRLGVLIRDGKGLGDLFSLEERLLTAIQRQEILTMIEDRLVPLIKIHQDHYILFSLPVSQLSAAQRASILSGISDRLDTLITDTYDLHRLFFLSETQLTTTQRTLILHAIESQLPEIIKKFTGVNLLFTRLNADQRTLIVNAIAGRLPAMIYHAQEFGALFCLSDMEFTSAQRAQFFTGIGERLASIFKNITEVEEIFSLSETQLSLSQRDAILTAIKPKLNRFDFTLGRNVHSMFQPATVVAEVMDEEKSTDAACKP